MIQNHNKLIVNSIKHKLNKAKVNGKLSINELSLLNLIDFLFIKANDKDKISLKILYDNIRNKFKYICNGQITPYFSYNNNNINNYFNMANFNINVGEKVNQPPTIGNGTLSTDNTTDIIFTRAHFTTNTTPPYFDPEGDIASLLKITVLPIEGTLKLNGVNILKNQIVDFTDIDAGNLIYSPPLNKTATTLSTFQFQIADAGSLTFVN